MSEDQVVDLVMAPDCFFLTARFCGLLDEETAWSALEYLLACEDDQPGYHLIVDLAKVRELDISFAFIHRMADKCRADDRRTGKTALVFGNHFWRRTFVQFYVTVVGAVSPSPGMVFQTFEQAEAWIRGGR